jgi:predicted ATPase/class 3 adenylate cyclase
VPLLDRQLAAVMFTDMVGYTALIQEDERAAVTKRDRYWEALERHHDDFGGTIVQRLGDGSMSMFPSSLAAVRAAAQIQQQLTADDISIRIGVHVGEVIVEPERLTGETVNIASRIESFAVAGGVLISDSAYDQIKNQSEIAAVSLGRFKLKNVGRPYELYALSSDGVAVPDPRALAGKGEAFASLPSHLPEPPLALVGREPDVTALVGLVRVHPIVTITGPGGVGKTRVLIELGRRLSAEFLDGVTFVALADLTNAASFIPALAEALDVKEAEGRTLQDGVVSLIGTRKALLLMDNFEQIVAAGPQLTALVESCPELRIVVTSRTPLRLAAEHEYLLSPLAVPADRRRDAIDSLLQYPAVALFVERAAAVRGSFELDGGNADAVVGVCQRLDGLPLAIELAAARLRLLTPAALLERLDHALDVLTSGPRDSPERQQTLRATIDWSHSLLTESEQRLFRRLAVFAGGCTLADLEAVCAEDGPDVLDELESLVDKALLQSDVGRDRFRVLQTIGDYARERLDLSSETQAIRLRHASRYASVAREIRDGAEGGDQLASIARGVVEESNLQASLDTLLAAARHGDDDACETGLRMCGDLLLYWHIRGKNLTAREYATSFLDAQRSGSPTAGRATALTTAGLASWALGEFERSNTEWAEAYRIATEIDDGRQLCVSALLGAVGLIGFDQAAALRWASESTERSRALGFTWGEGMASWVDGLLHVLAGDLTTAEARYARALDIQQRLGDDEGAGLTLSGLAQLRAVGGDLSSAVDLYRRSLEAFETVGDRAEEARVLSELAWTHLQDDDTTLARRRFLDSVQAYTDVASVRGVGLSLIGLAAAEEADGRPETAVQIAAAAEVYAGREGIVNVYSDETPGRESVERARASLPSDDVARAVEAGRKLTIGDALELVRAPSAPDPRSR